MDERGYVYLATVGDSKIKEYGWLKDAIFAN